MDKRKLIPSMFHRRLILILAVVSCVFLLMGLQLARLAVLEGERRLEEAESRLRRRSFLPTYRGRILDRTGRVLAQDRASYDVAVQYSVITGAWEERQAQREARRQIGSSQWRQMSPEAREAAIEDRLPHWRGETRRLWQVICELGDLDQETLDRRLDLIREQVQRTRAGVRYWQRERAIAKFGEDAEEGFTPQPIREERQPHVVLPRVSNEVAFAFQALAHDLEGMFVVQDSRRREYPWNSVEVVLDRSSLPEPIRRHENMVVRVDGVADHILGSVRDEVWAEDIQRRPFWLETDDSEPTEVDLGGYLVGDRVGSRGLEMVFEDHLRGLRGVIRERMDTDEKQRIDPTPGEDLHTTLDIRLQARVQAILSPQFGLTRVQQWHAGWQQDGSPRPTQLNLGTPMNSAAVVLEVDSGEILAAVSMPTLAEGATLDPIRQQASQVHANRPFEAVYPPGSIIKPFVLSAAVGEGVHHLRTPITCTGHYFPEIEDRARCWIYREQYGFLTHGSLEVEEAIARSCNMYFYTLADRLGMAALTKWYRGFGLGGHLDAGLLYELSRPDGSLVLAGESGGDMPTFEAMAEMSASGQLRFSSIIMGIGQGPVTWTPLQAANAYATLARGGVIRDATVLLDDPRGVREKRCDDLDLDPALVAAALEGLRRSVEETYGTGHHIRYADRHTEPILNVEGVTVWAKTGTAQAPLLRITDTNGDGRINSDDDGVAGLDHAWFVGLAGPEGGWPHFAISVVVEYGGSGGRVAGPIANQIIRALRAEGYLPRAGGGNS
ncbi:MAG: hypothetical protein JSV91_05120 [Phycisphaerales bacterium]|nr:MAG: hypothetical protein JSV91_05120 [Phycisphaerales bacterium]